METGIYGWRARLGYAGPTPLSTVPYEFWKMAPEGVALVTTGLHVDREFAAATDQSHQEIERAIGALDKFDLDAIAIGASPLCWQDDATAMQALADRIQQATRTRVMFTSDAVCHALSSLHATRIALVSPHANAVNVDASAYFARRGITVQGIGSYLEPQDRAPYEQVYTTSRDLLRTADAVDALYIAGDQWVIAPHIERLENELGVAVVGDTSAMLWHLLVALKIGVPTGGYGRLLSRR